MFKVQSFMAEVGDFLLAEVMLWLMYVTVAVTVVVTIVSVVRPLLIAPKKNASGRGWLVMGLTVVLLVVTYLAGSDQPLMVNGALFKDSFWLKVTDMLIVSSVILIVVAAGFVCFGTSGINRKISNRVHTKKA